MKKKVMTKKEKIVLLEKEKAAKTLDTIIKSIMAISGIFFLFSLLATPKVIGPTNVQLAPPLPNFMIYVFGMLLIIGVIYFVVTRAFKKRVSIPLSF